MIGSCSRRLLASATLGLLSTSTMSGVLPTVATSSRFQPIATQSVEDGPDLARRADEDARIAAATDAIARCEARLEAASAALRLDLPPRLRTRIWWTPVGPDLADRAAEVASRTRSLADASFTDLLTTNHPAVDRLQAQATVLRAVANALASRVSDDPAPWLERLGRFRAEAADGPDRTSALDGPTLLWLAGASLATPKEGASTAEGFHQRAGTVPDGIDALEFALLESLIKAGGLDANRRRATTTDLLKTPQPAADRLLLGAIHLDATVESGRSPAAAIEDTVRVMLPSRGVAAEDRVRVIRAFATIADASVTSEVAVGELPPLVALARLAPIVASGDPRALATGPARDLVERALTSTSPDVRAEAWLDAATLRMRGGDASGALDAIVSALETSPRHPKAAAAAVLAMRLAERIEDAAIFDEAVGRLLAALPDHPDRHGWGLLRGDRALAAGDRDGARTTWSTIPATSNVGVDAGLRLLKLDLDTLDDAGATRMLGVLDGLDAGIPDDLSDIRRVDADLLRIQALVRLERTTSAAEIAARFVTVTKIPGGALASVAQIALPALEAAGRTDDATRMRSGLASIDPTLATRAVGDRLRREAESVMAAIDRDDRAEARNLGKTALENMPLDLPSITADIKDRPDAAVQTGWLLAAAGRTTEARALADAVVAAHPAGLEALYLQAVLQGGRLESTGRTRPAPAETDAATAVRTLSRINAGSGRGSRWWWRSEIEKLEILAALDRDLAKIDARLERLETEFRNLGGPDFERRVRTLRASLQSRRVRE